MLSKPKISRKKGFFKMAYRIIPETKSRFLKIKCPGCGNDQIVFSKASSGIKCLVCSKELASSTGGKIIVKAKEFKELSS